MKSKSNDKRKVDIVVLSDVHLGTYGCHAYELCRYLKSIDPTVLILNGDILDMWQFKKYYFPESHSKVIKHIFSMMSRGTKVYYLTGNHDDILRKYSDLHAGNLHLVDKLLLNQDGQKTWIFHGDVFDVSMKYSRWLARLGGFGYDLLILLNSLVNRISLYFGYSKISLSKRIKDSVKSAIRFVDDFEITATTIAIDNHYDVVICGHIHKPVIRSVETEKGKVLYLNSGDWIENLSWLEYHEKKWNLLLYHEAVESGLIPTKQESEYEISKTPEVEITDKWQESQNGMTNMKLDKFPPLSNVLFTDINEQVLSD